MVIRAFPPLTETDENGLLAIGGDVEIESLLLAYRNGIFPWPFNEEFIAWFSPERRAILDLETFKVSRTLRKDLKKAGYEITYDQEFRSVVESCAELKNRKGQSGTWIIPEMVEGYVAFHDAGYAHSVETWKDGKLVGGLYGIRIENFFAGESMFYRAPNASKAALVALVEKLKAEGVKWIDCQVMNPFFESLGAKEISRKEYLVLLKKALSIK